MPQKELDQAVQARVEKWVRSDIQSLKAYQVADASGLIKLDAMENPYTWEEELKQQWLAEMQQQSLNRYPDPSGKSVVAGLKEVFGIDQRYDVLLGNGSDELIQIIIAALAADNLTVLSPEPSFVMYEMIAKFLRVNYVGVPLGNDFTLDLTAMLDAIEAHQPGVVFLAQPNNPTGNLFGEEKVRRIIEASPGLVVVDEAYLAFAESNALTLLADYSNLVVMRTLSKVGLAGLRLGFLVGHPGWINELNKVRLPYNINQLTQVSAQFALLHYNQLAEQITQLVVDRERLFESLQQLEGITVWPSQANFLLFRSLTVPAKALHQALIKEGVLIKCLDGAHPLLTGCLRVTVGAPAENEAFLKVLSALLS
ncbi:histidinol-phosphate transaminase [Spartinivicinus poritis]|uniref:Histidinol-phosphate aminotransferase n=1 Tax=Spartinivicinus poritis TaxID=2994640 RepID=A0ABT5U2T7_9GAMM|nr:histidinol-phosphate transaminase [Spartinivicinus sp. A2-2]MDE1460607.1 histidinol-phosphate transaminase [Spartinivicinus sp. A2-2]